VGGLPSEDAEARGGPQREEPVRGGDVTEGLPKSLDAGSGTAVPDGYAEQDGAAEWRAEFVDEITD